MTDSRDDAGLLRGDRAASLTNGRKRQHCAQDSHRSSRRIVGPRPQPVDLAQLLRQRVGAQQRPLEPLEVGELGLLARGQDLGVLPQAESGHPSARRPPGPGPLFSPRSETSRRTASSASAASWATTWKGSSQRFVLGRASSVPPGSSLPYRRRRTSGSQRAAHRGRRRMPLWSACSGPAPPRPAARCRGRRPRSGSGGPCGGRSRRCRSVAGRRAGPPRPRAPARRSARRCTTRSASARRWRYLTCSPQARRLAARRRG